MTISFTGLIEELVHLVDQLKNINNSKQVDSVDARLDFVERMVGTLRKALKLEELDPLKKQYTQTPSCKPQSIFSRMSKIYTDSKRNIKSVAPA